MTQLPATPPTEDSTKGSSAATTNSVRDPNAVFTRVRRLFVWFRAAWVGAPKPNRALLALAFVFLMPIVALLALVGLAFEVAVRVDTKDRLKTGGRWLASAASVAVLILIFITVIWRPGAGSGSASVPSPTVSPVMSSSPSELAVVPVATPTVVVPDLMGLTEKAAAIKLTDVGLLVGTGKHAYNVGVASGLIYVEDPAAGTLVDPGTYVSFWVSDGSPPKPTPTPKPTRAPKATPRPTLPPIPATAYFPRLTTTKMNAWVTAYVAGTYDIPCEDNGGGSWDCTGTTADGTSVSVQWSGDNASHLYEVFFQLVPADGISDNGLTEAMSTSFARYLMPGSKGSQVANYISAHMSDDEADRAFGADYIIVRGTTWNVGFQTPPP